MQLITYYKWLIVMKLIWQLIVYLLFLIVKNRPSKGLASNAPNCKDFSTHTHNFFRCPNLNVFDFEFE